MGTGPRSAYRQGMTTSAALARPAASPLGRMVRQTMVDSWYLLLAFPLSIISCTVVPTSVLTGTSSFFIFGLPILIFGLWAARGFAELERRRIGPVLGRRVARPTYKPAPE